MERLLSEITCYVSSYSSDGKLCRFTVLLLAYRDGLVLTQVPLNRSLMGDAAAVKAMQSDLLHALSSADHGGLVCAACNGVWICPEYKDMLYVCRGNVIGECTYC